MDGRNLQGRNAAKTQQIINVWMLFSAPKNATFFVVFLRVNAESVFFFSVLAIYRAAEGEWGGEWAEKQDKNWTFWI
ncbi:hypothetical protein L4D15_15880 [Enterovibrio norvegicus]|uniref:hypothetical protein n=1 Tax=Enterovibrio norvegicus TaxID=188144 RepID=UPI003D0CB14A